MKAWLIAVALVSFEVGAVAAQASPPGVTSLFPASGAADVSPDTRLKITFASAPPLGARGKIRVYDAADDRVVDELDLSIPPGPRNTRTPPPYDTLQYDSVPNTVFTVGAPDLDPSHVYQQTHIGGTTDVDVYHFFPVLLEEDVATISLHNYRLQYGKTYYVQIDREVFPFQGDGFQGIADSSTWTFSTKSAPPPADAARVTVAADGSGDFVTVQGAIDFVPTDNAELKTVFIRNGVYEEIVYFRDKKNLSVLGESRDQVIIRYPNNGVFNYRNLSPDSPNANMQHNLRAVFAVHRSSDINLINFSTISMGEAPAQAEGLLVSGDRLQVHEVSIVGSGDALQATGKIYLSGSSILGYGDNVLGYGAVFFKRCDLVSTFGPHLWVRNTDANHGNVFVESTFSTLGDVETDIARAPTNNGIDYPFCEAVLIDCKLEGVRPGGWGEVGPVTENIHYWEHDSVNLSDGEPVDVSRRAPYSRQLADDQDAQLIADYSNPAFVLDGWLPMLSPVLLAQPPATIATAPGDDVELAVRAVAEPEAKYQWFRDGEELQGETSATLRLPSVSAVDHGEYTVRVENAAGQVTSEPSRVEVEGVTASVPDAGSAGAGSASTPGADAAAADGGAGRASSPAQAASEDAAPPRKGATASPVEAAAQNSPMTSSESDGCSAGFGARRRDSTRDVWAAALWAAAFAFSTLRVRRRARHRRSNRHPNTSVTPCED